MWVRLKVFKNGSTVASLRYLLVAILTFAYFSTSTCGSVIRCIYLLTFSMVLVQSLVLSLLASSAAAAGVTGEAFGFAAGTTGGGDATAVYPADIDELTTYLTDDEPRVIVLNKEYVMCLNTN